jgi:hypothetical protein
LSSSSEPQQLSLCLRFGADVTRETTADNVEALHKEAIASDYFAVGWQLPDGELERPIPGARLVPIAGEPQARFDRATYSEVGWQLAVSAYSSREQVLETSSDFRSWSPVATNSADNFTVTFQDPEPGRLPQGFYRIRQQ